MKKKKVTDRPLCDNSAHPKYKGKFCLCQGCLHEDYYCTTQPCYGCDGPVTDCSYGEEEPTKP